MVSQEVEPATLATAWRAYKDPNLDPYQANTKMRTAIVDIINVCIIVCHGMHCMLSTPRPTSRPMRADQWTQFLMWAAPSA